jgi:hypothetical protein
MEQTENVVVLKKFGKMSKYNSEQSDFTLIMTALSYKKHGLSGYCL